MTRGDSIRLTARISKLERIVAILKAIDRVTTDAELVALLERLREEGV
jgi:hypothetical protein